MTDSQRDQPVDELDARLIETMAAHSRAGILEIARLLGVARNTVYARLERLERRGVIIGFGPEVDPAALGFVVTGFTTIEVTQGRFSEVVARLEAIPQVLEVHTVAGVGDLLCRVVARSNEGIMEIVELILQIPGVDRTRTALALAHPIRARPLPLVRLAVGE
ncbi:MAG: Lrp/AsnC family transcriptional regulator [Acidimicrobiia bacterium]